MHKRTDEKKTKSKVKGNYGSPVLFSVWGNLQTWQNYKLTRMYNSKRHDVSLLSLYVQWQLGHQFCHNMRCIDYGAEEKHMMFALFFSYAWSTGGIFGFPWLVNSPRYSRGGRRVHRLPSLPCYVALSTPPSLSLHPVCCHSLVFASLFLFFASTLLFCPPALLISGLMKVLSHWLSKHVRSFCCAANSCRSGVSLGICVFCGFLVPS